MQQILLGLGKAPVKTYVDDVFSTYLFKGNGSYPRTITNNINLSEEGGLVIQKSRSNGYGWVAYDTIRGAGAKAVRIDGMQGENSSNVAPYALLDQFNNNGFRLNQPSSTDVLNGNNLETASWTFRKSPMLDIVTYFGDGTTTGRAINHGLKSKPGFIIVKRLDSGGSAAYKQWFCYHDALPDTYQIKLSSSDPKQTNGNDVFGTGSSFVRPTSTQFTVGEFINFSGGSYVAYLFGGGGSDAATARSVDFDGSDDQLNIADNTDFELGNGDFTLETWVKSTQTTSSYKTAIAKWVDSGSNRSWMIRYSSQDIGTGWSFFYSLDGWNYSGSNGGTLMGSDISDGQWHHIAVTRTGGKIRTFTDGILNTTVSETGTFYDGSGAVTIGGQSGNYFDGQLSNVRLVKGTALYTSSFRPPTEPLTNVTNTKLLCCNNSSVTGSTVTPGTITASSSPTASSDSPFDDPAAHVFGESGSESVIKCGSYKGSSSADFEVNLGWEPQWIMFKRTDGSANWSLFDSMRGIVTEGNENYLFPNLDNAEYSAERISLTPTGFIVDANAGVLINQNGGDYIYIAIRSATGTMTRPPELGNQVFTPVFGSANAPLFKANNHVVDFTLQKNSNFATQDTDWNATARLMSGKRLIPNSSGAEQSNSYQVFDYQSGTSSFTGGSGIRFAWMWKRYAGLDVIAVKPKTGIPIPHGLNAIPEMIWAKDRDQNAEWSIYHIGLNGGTNPEQYRLKFTYDIEQNTANAWNDTAPTATHFTTGSWMNNNNMLFMLFTSISGISSIGSYAGSTSNVSVNCGFEPRFILIKERDATRQWVTFDTVRGIQSPGVDQQLYLSANYVQDNNHDYLDISSTGFTVKTNSTNVNQGSQNYIYYAHA